MKIVPLALVAAALAGCASTQELLQKAPDITYTSAKPRDAVAECLLNRLTSGEVRAEKAVSGGVTVVTLTSIAGLAVHPGLYTFSITDQGQGSTIEARVLVRGMLRGPDITNAKTCF